jgi:hypothetical protein
MQIAAALFGQISAGRDYFHDNLFVILPFSLAQIGCLAVANQGFEQWLLRAAANVELDIPAACRSSLVV